MYVSICFLLSMCLTINKLDKSDISSNMLHVGLLKHCNQFPWGLLYLCIYLVCGFVLGGGGGGGGGGKGLLIKLHLEKVHAQNHPKTYT